VIEKNSPLVIRTDSNLYTKKDGLLFNLTINNFDEYYAIRTISKINFEEIIEYVTYQEAFEHMKNGGVAVHGKFAYKFIAMSLHCKHTTYNDSYGLAEVNTSMLEPKWQLL
jgi:uncharacterized membrane protein YjfL (UPF0719 family)